MNITLLRIFYFIFFMMPWIYSRFNSKLNTERTLWQKKCLERCFNNKRKVQDGEFRIKPTTMSNAKHVEEVDDAEIEDDCDCNKDNDLAYFVSPPIEGTVWPLPQKIQYYLHNRSLARDGILFSYHGLHDADCDILKFAVDTYVKKWFFSNRRTSKRKGILKVSIHVPRKCPKLNEYPQQDMNEEFPRAGAVVLKSNEVWGILRGLETLSQLIFRSQGSYFIRTVDIHDWPEYPMRGILIDTSRHYLRKSVILRQIDIMAQNKMNTLHWHMVDMESFPYKSKTFENLSKVGAYTRAHVYTHATISNIVKYARLRGIRIIVEFDTPGHMSSWFGQKGLLAECRDPKGNKMPSALIDPTSEDNFEFLKKLFSEIISIFPDNYIHLGGDDVSFWHDECWKNNENITNFMLENKIADVDQLANFYHVKLSKLVASIMKMNRINAANTRLIFWDEVFQFAKDKRTIIHIWRPDNERQRKELTEKVTENGYNAILSSCWLLNRIVYGNDWAAGDELHSYYNCNPRNFNGTAAQKQLVLGGIAAMWGDYVDGSNIESRLWPRASAVAERLWSSPILTKDPWQAWPRLREHRCRLIVRGYRAQPVNGPDWCPIEYEDEKNL